MKKRSVWEAARAFDLSDTPDPSGKAGNPPVPTRPARRTGPSTGQTRPPLPGVRQEATPFGGPDRRSGTATGTPPGGTERRRSRTPTSQFQRGPDTPMQAASTQQAQAITGPGEHSWDVYVNGAGVYKVPASDEQSAKSRAMEWLNGGGDPEHHGRQFGANDFQAVRSTGAEDEGATVGGSLAGYQEPLSDEAVEAIRRRVREVVRKKAGGGGFKLYAPNQGKKKDAKPVGEFPTKVQAKEAELQRFPPKDPEQLKRARKRLDKLKKDPKKRIEKEKEQMSGRKGPTKRKAKKSAKREALIRQMVRDIRERLFREDEVPGSPWDERIGSLHPDALASDKKLHMLHKGLEGASIGALGDGHKLMAKALRGVAKVHPGEHAFDTERKKMYLPVHLDVGGSEVGPIHLYVDGGHVKIEMSQDAKEQIAGLEPPKARDLRGGLMDLEEDHLPKIDRARKAWGERDAYLDKVHGKLEKQIGGMSGVEAHLAKALLQRHGKGKK